MVKKYHIALVIGRFQPFHRGHLYLIKKALELANSVIIGIGSSNVINHDNPYAYGEREKMLKKELTRAELEDKVIKIIPLPDMPDDDEWLVNTMKLTGPVDFVIGNNDWVNELYRNIGIPTLTVPFYKRHIYEGTKIRARLRQAGKL